MLPLVDITASTSEWPSGYESLITRDWPGTVDGCDCSHAWSWDTFHYRDLERGSCSYNQTRDGCINIRRVHPIPLEKFYSSKICGLREGSNFAETKRPQKIGGEFKCELGYKKCGKGDGNKVLCIREQERCPINHVEILSGGKTKKPGYEVVPIDPGSGVSFN